MSKFLEVGVEVFRGAIVLALFAMIAALPAENVFAQSPPPVSPPPQLPPNIPVRPYIPPEPSREAPPSSVTPPPAVGNAIPEGADKVTVVVKDIKIEGATAYTAEELAPYYTKLIGQTVPVSAIFEAAEAITLKYREDGYILSQALVPEQRVSDGVYTIRVVEGYVSEVVVTGDIGAVRDLIQDMVNHIPEERPINNATIERYLLLARDVPGIALTGVFRVAAGGAGARQLVLQVSRKEFGGNFAYDNRGSRFLGPGEMSGEVQVNSFTTYGERLDFVYFNTLSLLKGHPIIGVGGGDDQRFGEATFSAYLGSDGLQFKIFAGAGPANPGYTLASALFHSDLETAGGGLEYPIVRSRAFDLKVRGQFDMTNSTVRTGANQTLASGTFLRVLRSYLTELEEFVEQMQFDRLGVFTYSQEEGTTAHPLGDPVPTEEKLLRQARLYDIQAEVSLAKNLAKIGSFENVLIERKEVEEDGLSPNPSPCWERGLLWTNFFSRTGSRWGSSRCIARGTKDRRFCPSADHKH